MCAFCCEFLKYYVYYFVTGSSNQHDIDNEGKSLQSNCQHTFTLVFFKFNNIVDDH